MSNYFDEDDGECETIYGLIPKPPPVIEKPPLYVSSYKKKQDKFVTVKKLSHATMGEPKERLHKSPRDFLRKGTRCIDPITTTNYSTRTRSYSSRPYTSHGNATLAKPPVPEHVVPRTPPAKEKNFILENWKNAPKTKKLHPEKPVTRYTEKKDFGKVPKYLNRVKKEAQAENAYWDEVRETMMPRDDNEQRCRLLPEDERINILDGLKANYNDLMKRYGTLSLGQDNLSFRKRKEAMEREMAQLEEDIKMFSRQNIYISE